MPAPNPSLRVTSRRLAAAVLWVALLGGVLAMHGLSTHGVAGALNAPLVAVDHGVAHVAMSPSHGAMPAGHPFPGHGHTGTAMLCLAFLIAAIFVALLTWHRRRRPILVVERVAHRWPPRPGTTHPPPLAHLSLMRC